MVNINSVFSDTYYLSAMSAYLTGIIIALQCLSFLAIPITAPTRDRTVSSSTLPKFYLIFACIKMLFAYLTNPFDFHSFRFAIYIFRLPCAEFRPALVRTKSSGSAGPRFKFFFTPLANTYFHALLGTRNTRTFTGTKTMCIISSWESFKFVMAVFTNIYSWLLLWLHGFLRSIPLRKIQWGAAFGVCRLSVVHDATQARSNYILHDGGQIWTL